MIKSICVCGAGTMGTGIAQAAAQHGFTVTVYDIGESMLKQSRMGMENNLQSLVNKNKISASTRNIILDGVSFTSSYQSCIADFVIEAILEKPLAKQELFRQLFEVNSEATIFATNTSSLSVTEIARALPDPSRVVGMHFFNPATIMKLVEVVQTEFNSAATIELVMQLALDMGKKPVRCIDAPGFIVNRVARPYYIEALRLAEEGVSMTVIDALMESAGFKMGPFHLMDLIGNDINYAVSCSVYEQLGKPSRLTPSAIQQQIVAAGKLGRKSGEGYYTY
ncbi:3-hydroxyacyl-CoA dehydrogenase NAD-binding domain-containing protein [Flavihumibacter sediminis]|nr:3-hydroxyacyl-CoA dehydrogenase NAD-binding domain-containing protein [Flavihumibacter sediminis]